MKAEIDVTPEDIECGNRGCPRSCPVALAIRRVFGDRIFLVFPAAIRIYSGPDGPFSVARIVRPPEDVRRFVLDFDRRRRVSPFRFTLDDGEGG